MEHKKKMFQEFIRVQIHDYRSGRAYTQEQMAELLGVSTGFYGMMERGEKAPSIEKLIIIYEKLGTDITYLLTGDQKEGAGGSFLERCPKEKQYDLEQLMKYAFNLAEIGTVKIET